jgi:hypothetical protein
MRRKTSVRLLLTRTCISDFQQINPLVEPILRIKPRLDTPELREVLYIDQTKIIPLMQRPSMVFFCGSASSYFGTQCLESRMGKFPDFGDVGVGFTA